MKNHTYLTGFIIGLLLLFLPYLNSANRVESTTFNEEKTAPSVVHEEYDPELFKQLKSTDALVAYINQNYQGSRNSTDFVIYIGKVVSKRFYHGYSTYADADNWIAAFLGCYLWDDLSAIVAPDDIMKHPNAACSQQSMIVMECVRRFGFDYRKVTFDHHYALEVKIKNNWQFIDTNIEVFPTNSSIQKIIKGNKLSAIYKGKLTEEEILLNLANPKTGSINEAPAPNALRFHLATKWLSNNLFFVIIILQTIVFFGYTLNTTFDEISL